MSQYVCQYEQHFGQKIQGYCINSDCKSKPQFCQFCLNEYHKDHQNDCKDKDAIIQLIQQLIDSQNKFILETKNYIQTIEQIIQQNLDQPYQEIEKLKKMQTYLSTEAYNDFKDNINVLKQYNNKNQQMKDGEFLNQLEIIKQAIINATDKRKNYHRQLEENKFKARMFYENGLTLSTQQQYQNAIDNFTQAIQLDSNNYEYHIAKSNQLLNLYQYEQAIQCCQAAIQLNSQSYVAYCNYGFALNRIKQQEQARNIIAKAIEINPKEVQAYILKGEILFEAQSYQDAIQYLDKAIEINPCAYPAYHYKGKKYNTLALTLNKLNKYEEALNISYKALQIKDNNLDIYILITYILNQLKDFRRAIYYCNEAMTRNMKSESLYNNKGYALLNLKQYSEAIQNFDKALEINLNFELALSNKGDALANLEQFQQAIINYKEAFKISNNQTHQIKQLKLECQIRNGNKQQQQLQIQF